MIIRFLQSGSARQKFSFGLIIVGCFLAGRAHAQCVDGTNAAAYEVLGDVIRNSSWVEPPLSPISDHYVKEVLFRTQKALNNAETYTETADASNEGSFQAHLDIAYSIAAKANDIRRISDLRNTSACMHIDFFLLESMMDRVSCRAEYALKTQKYVALTEIEKVMDFLLDRYRQLQLGSYNPAVEDLEWWRYQSFDDPQGTESRVWCCDPVNSDSSYICAEVQRYCLGAAYLTLDGCVDNSTCEAPAGNTVQDQKMCPFDSDYLPPSVAIPSSYSPGSLGYGCDLYVLRSFSWISSSGDTFPNNKIDEALKAEYNSLSDALQKRDVFIGNSFNLRDYTIEINRFMGRTPPPELDFFGMTTEANRTHSTRIGCNAADGSYPSVPTGPNFPPAWPESAIRKEIRGSFSVDRSEWPLLNIYGYVKHAWGNLRKVPDQFQKTTEDRNAPLRLEVLQEGIDQELLDVPIFPSSSDPMKQILGYMEPVRSSVSELSRYANSLNNGVRNFARGLAWYLRRSCINRPCNARLENILKIVLEDECFPYTDGEYLSHTEANNTYEQCHTAAGF